ncbi:M10 family metallopeptidase C-terminal domain-containing protein, partial [Microvirga sp. 2MCAF35]|uniref:M10 family metallopeptidase C-terminal domain-containing protein n=1 Tax=Microvirga sp. 2MCAF35 TaxID=3232987 RepID=UPI003F9698D4
MAQKSQTFATSVDPNVAALLSGSRWANATVTYSFPDAATDYPYSIGPGFTPADIYQKQVIQGILEGVLSGQVIDGYSLMTSVEGITNLDMQYIGEVSSDIAISADSTTDRGGAFYPGDQPMAGDIVLPIYSRSAKGLNDIMHEIGHALGLQHGHNVLSPDRDSKEFSIMTYRDYVGEPFNEVGAGDYPSTYMMYDIAALQYLYGANFNFNSTDSFYSFDPASGDAYLNGVRQVKAFGRNVLFMTIWDGGGNDTYDLTAYSTDLTVDLAPGGWSVFSRQQLADLSGTGIMARGNVFNALQYNGDPRSLIENVRGGSGNDKITGNSAANTLSGNFGNDTLFGLAGNDTLYGGEGNDTLFGGQDHDMVYGGAGNDAILGEAGNDYIDGGDLNDALDGNSGDDTILGGSGNDLILGNAGADSLDGGDGIDVLSYAGDSTGVSVDLRSNSVGGGTAQGDRISNFEAVDGGWGRDTIFGSHGDNTLYGGGGDDLIFGEYGTDTIWGQDGHDELHAGNDYSADTVYGGVGDDTIYGSLGANLIYGGIDNDVIYAGQGDDWITGEDGNDFLQGEAGNDIILGGAGADTLDGGTGTDALEYGDDLTGIYIDLRLNFARSGLAEGDVIRNFETVYGGDGNDTLYGSADDNYLMGRGGNDTIAGAGGNDTVLGSDGNDLLYGDDGQDSLNGGRDNDTLHGGLENDTLVGHLGDDSLYGENGSDSLSGGDNNDTLNGGAGADVMDGGGGIDTLDYSADLSGVYVDIRTNSAFYGEAAGDVISNFENVTGGAGNDTLYG